MPPRGGGGSGSGPSRPTPLAVPQPVGEGSSSSGSVSGSESMASEGTSQSVSCSVSPSSYESESGSGSGGDRDSDSDSDSGCDIKWNSDTFRYNPEGALVVCLMRNLPYHGRMLLLFETPSGFALFTFSGCLCYLPDRVNDIWASFDSYFHSRGVVCLKEFRSFEDKSSVINADTGVDKQLVDLINKWHKPGMKLCVGKPEYEVIIESKLKIPCMYCQTVMEIMWGIQHQMRKLVPQEKSELTKEDRLPMSQGLKKFLSCNGFDVKPEMVNEKIVAAASALFKCDEDDRIDKKCLLQRNIFLREADWIAKKCVLQRHIFLREAERVAKKKRLGSLIKEAYEEEEKRAQRETEQSTSEGRKRKWTTLGFLWDWVYCKPSTKHHKS